MLRVAAHSDVETIRRWRNHPKVRRASIWTGRITPKHHATWWASVQRDPARHVLIFEHADIPSGVVTINDHDRTAASAEWGFFLDIDGLTRRGELVPAWLALEREAIQFAFSTLDLWEMGCRTLRWNRPVIELHRRFGFVEIPERGYTTLVAGVEQAVVWLALTADRREGSGRR